MHFDFDELSRRVVRTQAAPATVESVLRCGRLEIDLLARLVHLDGLVVETTAKEFDLLAFLATRPGHVFSRAELLRSVWQSDSEWQDSSTVTEHIYRLRAKIDNDPTEPRLISTVRGAGYRFDVPEPVDDRSAPPREPRVGTFVYVERRIVAADQGAADLLGEASPETLIGRDIVEPFAMSSKSAALARLEMRLAGRTPGEQIMSIGRPDSEVYVSVNSVAVEFEGCAAVRLEIREILDPPRLIRQLVTGVASEIADAVIVTDAQTHVLSWNRGAERLYGWRESEVLGHTMSNVVGWHPSSGELAASSERLHKTGRWTGEVVQIGRDGTPMKVWASVSLIRDDEGETAGIVAINRAVFGTMPQLDASVVVNAEEVRRALEAGDFTVSFQPIVTMRDRRTIAVEATLGWIQADGRVLAPDSFLPALEGAPVVQELALHLIRHACDRVHTWKIDGHPVDLVANLSTTQLTTPGLANAIAAELARTDLAATTMWVEVSEQALVEDLDAMRPSLSSLVKIGARIVINDFGAGWASLAHLRTLDVHALKIDARLTRAINHEKRHRAVVRSIVALGEELNVPVVAMGIETEDQHEALFQLGCDIGQGPLYALPGRAEQVRLEDADKHDPQIAD